jgi:hypothetical protein
MRADDQGSRCALARAGCVIDNGTLPGNARLGSGSLHHGSRDRLLRFLFGVAKEESEVLLDHAADAIEVRRIALLRVDLGVESSRVHHRVDCLP